jgi:D-glycerate 3-kinase
MNAKSGCAADALEAAVRARLERSDTKRPMVVGLCGSQGSGKSTACANVAAALAASGISTAVLSLDDLYLPRAAREELARRVHPLLLTRGAPGTHEISLGLRTLEALGTRRCVLLPRFDKGRDDREPESRWQEFDAPADVVLFEGWCVGARPQSPGSLELPVNALERREDVDGCWRRHVNDALARDYQRLFAPIDFLVLLAAPAFEVVTRWRTEQERQLRASQPGARVMTDSQIERFVQHYERLTRHILAEMPSRADLVLRLDENRRVVE